jgi:hypothetical protein
MTNYEVFFDPASRTYELADHERMTYNVRRRGGVWLSRVCTVDDNGKHERYTVIADDKLIGCYNTAVSQYQSQRDSASTPRVDGLYNRTGQRFSPASERPVVRRMKQPRGVWRDGRGE